MAKFVDFTKGTEKQMQYAELIRQTNENAIIKFCEASKVKFTSPDEAKTAIAHTAIDNALARFYRASNAIWMIENKNRLESKIQEWFMTEIKEKMSQA